ncbi:MAG TPA: CHAT domain-containing tetratricopeptide repeat protein [Herpetosiphonaceae bacterium]
MLPPSDLIPPACRRLLALAECDPRRVLPLARRALGQAQSSGDSAMQAWATYTVGWTLLRWERLSEAQTVLRQALDAFTATQMATPALYARAGLLIAALLQAGKSALLSDWEELAVAFEAQGLPLATAQARFHICWLLNILGRPYDALALADTIRPLLMQAGAPRDQGRLLRVMTVAYGDCGQLDQASAAIEEAIACFTRRPIPGAVALHHMPIELARCWLERSWLLQRRERFTPALEDLQRARAIFARHELPMRLAFCDEHIGLLQSRLGHYDQALAATVRARAVFAEIGRADVVANCDMHVGIIAYYCGLFELALSAYRRAQLIYAEQGIERLSAVCQRNIALVRRAQGELAEALEILSALKAAAEARGADLELAEIVGAEAQILHDLHEDAAALPLLQRAEAIFDAHQNLASVGKCRLEQGWLQLEQQRPEAAAACFEAARQPLSDRPIYLWRLEYGLGRCAALLDQPEVALAYYQQASAMLAKLRRVSSEHASSGIFTQARQLFTSAIQLAVQCDNPLAILELTEQQRSLAFQQQLTAPTFLLSPELQPSYEQRRERLRELSARSSVATSAELSEAVNAYIDVLLQARQPAPVPNDLPATPLDVPALRQALSAAYPQGWLVVVYVPGEADLAIVTLDASSLALHTTPMDARLHWLLERVQLRKHQMHTYADIPYLEGKTAVRWHILAELGDRLLPQSLRDRLAPDGRLIIIPGSVLHSLPWSALRLDGSWLAERAVVQLLPSLKLWPTLAARTAPGTAALLVGCETFGPRAPALPNVTPALDLVEDCWQGKVERLEGMAARRGALLDLARSGELRQYGQILFATHGQLVAAQGLLAHLKLIDDDILYDEVARLDLDGTIVVLAACEGAVGEVLPGEEVLSLSRAFLVAGARDVIASLWRIYDQTVLILLEPLYQALAGGRDAASALADAQRAVIDRSQREVAAGGAGLSPLVWASFCSIGVGTD